MKHFILLTTVMAMFACHHKMTTGSAGTQGKPPATATDNAALPVCIQAKIDSIKQLPVWNPPASVELYDYNGRKIYVFSADCCDFFSTAFDENCNYLCAPSGGFTGKGDGLCPDFSEKAKLVKVVWRDERTKK